MSIYKTARFVTGSLIAAFLVAGLAGVPVVAQEKAKEAKTEKGKAVTNVLIDNEKVLVVETRYRPGDIGEEDRSVYRVNRTLQGGTLQRIYPDGKTETVQLKTGTVRYVEPSKAGNFKVKNIGKTTVVSYVVRLK
jgi:hypothetical protein